MKGYYFITDARLSLSGLNHDVRSAIKAGVKIIQYRRKDVSTILMYKEAFVLRALCKNAIFLINDRVDIAFAVNADGVHLGQEDLPYTIARSILGKKKIIGVTVHNLRQALLAAQSGADYLAVSPIFSTSTKADAGKPVGLALIENIKKHVSIPVVAIGGINLANAESVIQAGADCLCAISAVVTKKDVKGEIEKFQRLFKKH
ncbi:MAG: thiamine phosphate synthase [Candidatus Omnitrophica bacterium]|nr:thiamine phosphate synthase [Candidatus Omnitrophota bacterium]